MAAQRAKESKGKGQQQAKFGGFHDMPPGMMGGPFPGGVMGPRPDVMQVRVDDQMFLVN